MINCLLALGTTWVQEIVYLIGNKMDFEGAKKHVLETRFPFLEYPYPGLSSVEKMPSPRFIKTHLPFEFLPDSASNSKIIYVARNPKDTLVSYYHFSRMFTMSNFVGTFQEFLSKFKSDERTLEHSDLPNYTGLIFLQLLTRFIFMTNCSFGLLMIYSSLLPVLRPCGKLSSSQGGPECADSDLRRAVQEPG